MKEIENAKLKLKTFIEDHSNVRHFNPPVQLGMDIKMLFFPVLNTDGKWLSKTFVPVIQVEPRFPDIVYIFYHTPEDP